MNDPDKFAAGSGLWSCRRRLLSVLAALAILCTLAVAVLYHYLISGGLIARRKPSAVETFVAQTLVDWSIPDAVKTLKNPLPPSAAAVAAGRVLYQHKCEVCHGYDGTGNTAAGAGLYQPPLSLNGLAL